MKKAALFLVLCFAVLSCKKEKDDPQGPTMVFKFTMDLKSSVDPTPKEEWVIVTKSGTGELIDYKMIAPGQSITIESNKLTNNDKIDVTTFIISSYTIGKQIRRVATADVFTGLDVRTEWKVDAASQPSSLPSNLRQFTLRIDQLPEDYSMTLSDKYGLLNGFNFDGEGNLSATVNVHDGAETQIFSVYPGYGNPKYILFENVKAGPIDRHYSDFNEFDKIVKVSLPQPMPVSASITAFDAGQIEGGGYEIFNNNFYSRSYHDYAYSRPMSSINLGFLNRFQTYIISLYTGRFWYYSIGAAPSSITYVDPSVFKITDRSFTNFAMSSSQPYVMREVAYSYLETNETGEFSTMTYVFHETHDMKHYQTLPSEILQKYSIKLANLSFAGADVYVKSQSYADFLKGLPLSKSPGGAERIRVSVN